MRRFMLGVGVMGLFILYGQALTYPMADDFQFPLDEYASGPNDFGTTGLVYDPPILHLGEDVTTSAGTKVKAPANGLVQFSGSISGYGGMYLIEHNVGEEYVVSVIAHLNVETLTKKSGEEVSKGEYLGQIGTKAQNGGWGEHLHYGIRKGRYITGSYYYFYDPTTESWRWTWAYLGYSKNANLTETTKTDYDVMHEKMKSDWYDPTDFILMHTELLPGSLPYSFTFTVPSSLTGFYTNSAKASLYVSNGKLMLVQRGDKGDVYDDPQIWYQYPGGHPGLFWENIEKVLVTGIWNTPDAETYMYLLTESQNWKVEPEPGYLIDHTGIELQYVSFPVRGTGAYGEITGFRLDPSVRGNPNDGEYDFMLYRLLLVPKDGTILRQADLHIAIDDPADGDPDGTSIPGTPVTPDPGQPESFTLVSFGSLEQIHSVREGLEYVEGDKRLVTARQATLKGVDLETQFLCLNTARDYEGRSTTHLAYEVNTNVPEGKVGQLYRAHVELGVTHVFSYQAQSIKVSLKRAGDLLGPALEDEAGTRVCFTLPPEAKSGQVYSLVSEVFTLPRNIIGAGPYSQFVGVVEIKASSSSCALYVSSIFLEYMTPEKLNPPKSNNPLPAASPSPPPSPTPENPDQFEIFTSYTSADLEIEEAKKTAASTGIIPLIDFTQGINTSWVLSYTQNQKAREVKGRILNNLPLVFVDYGGYHPEKAGIDATEISFSLSGAITAPIKEDQLYLLQVEILSYGIPGGVSVCILSSQVYGPRLYLDLQETDTGLKKRILVSKDPFYWPMIFNTVWFRVQGSDAGLVKIKLVPASSQTLTKRVASSEISEARNQGRLEISPNPFNSQASITFHNPRSQDLKLKVYNLLGQEVRVLLDVKTQAGKITLVWDGQDEQGREVSAGVYFLRLSSETGDIRSAPVMLVK